MSGKTRSTKFADGGQEPDGEISPLTTSLGERAVQREQARRHAPSTLYFTYMRTDGDSFVGPATHAESTCGMGYTITGEQTIDNFAEWMDEQSAKTCEAAAKPAAAPAAKTSA